MLLRGFPRPAPSSTNSMSVSFSLKKAKPAASTAQSSAPPLKKATAFASLDDDEPIDAAPTASASNAKATSANRSLANQALKLSKTQKKVADEAKRVDATVYEYDEVWDKIQAAKARQKEMKEADSQERKVRAPTALSILISLRHHYSLNISAPYYSLLQCGG